MPHATIQELLSEIFDKSVHNQILESLEHRRELGNHVDLDSWIGMFFEAVLSRGQCSRQKFIVNKLLNKWFEASSFVLTGYSTVACINITHGTEGTFARTMASLTSLQKSCGFMAPLTKGLKA